LRFKRYGAIAASCVLAIALGLFGHSVLRGSHYATPIGGIRNVALADGSHITLNTDTSLRARISDNERHIELDRGEAFFEVSKDTARPFIVYAGDKRIMAVGTQFSVRRVDDEVKVVVTEGLVKLAAADAFTTDFPQMTSESVVGPAASDGTDSATYLRAGAVAKTLKTRVLVSEDAAANAEKLLTWRQGYIFFDSMPLAEAVAEFNRYTTRKIVIQDPGVAAIRISGKFGSANAEAFVRVLRDGFGVDVQSTDERILLTRLADSRLPAAD
jgi:transmembrane sensor